MFTDKAKLTNKDYQRAASKIRCEVAAIKAVADTESKGNAFYADGFPVILFERHKFRKYTNHKFNTSHPHLSGPAGNYGKPGQNQRNKFNEAFALDPEAAMKSCSWGKFQIMGFNHEVCGYKTVGEFVDAMKESEGKQLDAFVGFVIGNDLDDEIRSKDWAGFAYGYNGEGYKANKYDKKMAAAYRRFAAEKDVQPEYALAFNASQQEHENVGYFFDQSSAVPTPDQPSSTPVETAAPTAVEPVQVELSQAESNTTVDIKAPEPQGLVGKLSAGVGTLFGGTLIYTVAEKFGGMSFSMQTIILLSVVGVLALLGFIAWAAIDAWKQAQRIRVEALQNGDPTKANVRWK